MIENQIQTHVPMLRARVVDKEVKKILLGTQVVSRVTRDAMNAPNLNLVVKSKLIV